jgi:hypothetical protein
MRPESPLYLAENSKNSIHIRKCLVLIKNHGKADALPCPKESFASDWTNHSYLDCCSKSSCLPLTVIIIGE